MAKPQQLDAFETDEAVAALHNILQQSSARFSEAFLRATETLGMDYDGRAVTVASQWALIHARGLPKDTERAKMVANMILGDATTLRSVYSKARFILVEELFPFFDLPAGWRRTAEESGFSPHHIAWFITQRVLAIRSREDANRERPFLRQLLSLPNEEAVTRPPTPEEISELKKTRYMEILSTTQLRQIRAVVHCFAPELLQEVRDPRSMGWRHRLL